MIVLHVKSIVFKKAFESKASDPSLWRDRSAQTIIFPHPHKSCISMVGGRVGGGRVGILQASGGGK